MSVKILSSLVANQIAAGEVVERPASVVKELVENSLDAGATEITVSIIDGGRALIQIIDNGKGMSEKDARLSLERFATSKLEAVSDFDKLSTFGFRGEALPSISSVSMLTLETSNGEESTRLICEGGKIVSEHIAKSVSSPGTTVSVRELFFNVPARRSFLKSERSEISLIRAVLSDFAVCRPEVRLTLIIDGQTSLILPAKRNEESFDAFIERVRDLKLSSSDLLECSAEIESPSGKYRVQAGLTKPLDCVSGAAKLRLLVNGRGVRDKILLRAVRDAYGTFLRADKYPAGVVKLEVPPVDLDVNVHPQKAEIRFRAADRVFSVTRQAIGVALRGVDAGSRADASFFPTYEDSSLHSSPQSYSGQGYSGQSYSGQSYSGQAGTFDFSVSSSTSHATEGRVGQPQAETLKACRYVGQIFYCYLLFEKAPDLFVIVDMHAAHERITFAKLKKGWSEGELRSQQLLLSEIVNLPNHLSAEEEELITVLESLGFELSKMHQNQFALRAVPEILARVSPKELIHDLFSEISVQDLQGALERKVDSVLNRIACHGSIRSGQELSTEEAYQLLDDLDSTELKAFCPHGRSVARVLTKPELERLFGRSE